ncbi:DUF2911 domain-containing protein [Flavobacterium cerinum]|uniref:DUF2911 domain-containing protein n=1 Tax=Flavobacterium cerinum TaxID=2502784 RepID=A0A3S3QD76_9FLAO|nr:DUF2911 domain-containing protein [Flavobacterium cerinum]RWX00398.1 DUF2911 domain-containing protein [Flavobacterium cerinum]
MKFTTKITMLLVAVFMTTVSVAQEKKQASPAATAKGTISGANITINYSSPFVKGRVIWGELVPYNKVWRAGANAPTTFETDKALKIEGKDLPAGKYAVYVIPEKDAATVVFGKDPKMSAYDYDQAKDQLRVKVKTKKSAKMNESLVYTVNKNNVTLSWENLDIPVSVK